MAFTKVLSDISPTVAIIGTVDPAGATDDIRTTGSPVKFTPRVEFIDLEEHKSTFTQDVGIPAARQWDITYQFWMQGSGSLGTVAVNGYAGIDATLRMAAMTRTASAGTSITYAPSTIAALSSGIIWAENDGLLHKGTACVGNVVLEGAPTSGMTGTFTGVGAYVAPTIASISGFVGGTSRAEAFLDIQGTVTPAGGSGYVPKVSSIRFDRGVDTARIVDANNATGIDSNFVRRARPSLTCTWAVDKDSGANLTYPNVYANMLAKTVHGVKFRQGTTAGNIATFTIGKAQIRSVTQQQGDGYQLLQVTYNQTHTSAEGEFTIVIT